MILVQMMMMMTMIMMMMLCHHSSSHVALNKLNSARNATYRDYDYVDLYAIRP
jgi:hypothetical protein